MEKLKDTITSRKFWLCLLTGVAHGLAQSHMLGNITPDQVDGVAKFIALWVVGESLSDAGRAFAPTLPYANGVAPKDATPVLALERK